jgi:serine/threonine protein kinase
MLYRKTPFQSSKSWAILSDRISAGEYKIPLSPLISEPGRAFIRRLLQKYPKDRPTAEEALQDP